MEQQAPPAIAWFVSLLFVGTFYVWSQILLRLFQRRALVPYEARRAAPWRGADVALVVLIQFGVYSIPPLAAQLERGARQTGDSVAALREGAQAEERAARLEMTPLTALAFAASSLAGVGVMIAALRKVSGATWYDLGFVTNNFPRDATLGAAGMLAVALPVYTIQFIATQFFPSEHPLLKMLTENPNKLYLAVSCLLAVLVAPLVEELLFRVVLQGWLEARETRWRRRVPALAWLPRGALPIFLSATPFALLHSSSGPDPIALFPLAVTLGYLYRQTHRLWPSLVMHLCFNGTSVGLLWLQLQASAAM